RCRRLRRGRRRVAAEDLVLVLVDVADLVLVVDDAGGRAVRGVDEQVVLAYLELERAARGRNPDLVDLLAVAVELVHRAGPGVGAVEVAGDRDDGLQGAGARHVELDEPR